MSAGLQDLGEVVRIDAANGNDRAGDMSDDFREALEPILAAVPKS